MNRRALTGHFFGFYAGGGKYDLQWEEKGYQGEFYIASGISYGYALPIAHNLNFEFCIGIGLLIAPSTTTTHCSGRATGVIPGLDRQRLKYPLYGYWAEK